MSDRSLDTSFVGRAAGVADEGVDGGSGTHPTKGFGSVQLFVDRSASASPRPAFTHSAKFPESEPPAWVAQWLSSRDGRATEKKKRVVRKGMLRKKVIEVSLLSDLPLTLVRDGVEKKGAPQGTGEKAWWTQQAIGLVPPAFWCQSLGMNADDLVEAAAQGEDGKLLSTAWANATMRLADPGWARALLLAGSPPEHMLRDLFRFTCSRRSGGSFAFLDVLDS